jgi:ubiquinone/menaquinone biosynthesis C-methylase UbiE
MTSISRSNREPKNLVRQIEHSLGTVWLARENRNEVTYFYGGTRVIDPSTSESAAKTTLIRLTRTESGIKNSLIDWSIRNGVLQEFEAALPPGFLHSRVAGARCLIQPRTSEIASSLADPLNGRNVKITNDILQFIAEILNQNDLLIKLTPDFGRNTGLADVLHRYTPHVLGIRCEAGGCGGKSSYAVTGLLAAVRHFQRLMSVDTPVTCIGSAGALGSGVLNHFLVSGTEMPAVCDLVYDHLSATTPPDQCLHLKSRPGVFTRACLTRGGIIIATTCGDELASSPWRLIKPGTVLLLAHNLALPYGTKGIELARALRRQGVLVIPGQLLTLGGALTARLEWYWRQLPAKAEFDKALAHRVVQRTVEQLITALLSIAGSDHITPYEAMLQLASEGNSKFTFQTTSGPVLSNQKNFPDYFSRVEILPRMTLRDYFEFCRARHPRLYESLNPNRPSGEQFGELYAKIEKLETHFEGKLKHGRGDAYREAQNTNYLVRSVGFLSLLDLATQERKNIQEDFFVLDALGGNGTLTRIVRASRPAEKIPFIVTSDVSSEMIQSALSQNLPAIRQPLQNLIWFNDRIFNAVIVAYGTHHIPPAERYTAIAEAYRVLKPGGRIVLQDFEIGCPTTEWYDKVLDRYTSTGHRYQYFNRKDFRELLVSNGFTDVEVLDVYDPFILKAAGFSEARRGLLDYIFRLFALEKLVPDNGVLDEQFWDKLEAVVVETSTFTATQLPGRRVTEFTIARDGNEYRAEVPRVCLVATGRRPAANT